MQLLQRSTIVFIGFFESLIFSGCLFGWPSLLHVLQQEGVYSHLCHHLNVSFLVEDLESALNLQKLESSWTTNEFLLTQSSTPIANQNVLFQDLTQEGNYTHLNTINEETLHIPSPNRCDAQTVEMTLVYTIAAVSYGLTSILIGFSLDICGLWFTRILGSIMTTAGFICLAFTSKESSWLLWPALNLIALGSSQLRLSTFQFANLWPSKRTTILIIYSSAYSVSTTMFLVIQYLYSWDISFKTIGLFFTLVTLLTFPATFCMPKMKIEDHVDSEKGHKLSGVFKDKKITRRQSEDKEISQIKYEERIPMNIDEKDRANKATIKQKEFPLGASLWTLSSLLHTFWHFINVYLILFYSSTFLPWIHKMTDDTDKVAHYNKISGLCALIAPFFIPIAGLITDWQIQKASRLEDRIEKLAQTMQAPAFTMIFATLFVLATMICKLFFTEAAIYISLVLIAISRPFIVGSCASYIRIRFHPSHFNRLNGIFTTVISIFSLVQYPIILWMKKSTQDFINAQILLIILLILSLVSPGHMMIKPLARKYAKDQINFRTDV